MKTKMLLNFTATLFAYLIACAVILSHTHASDVLRQSLASLPSTAAKAASTDTPAKVGGDLHTHIDKTMIKNIMKTAADSTAARRSELEKSELAGEEGLLDRFLNSLLMLRVMMTLPVSAQFA